MWSLGDLKTPLGVMETLAGTPAFYIKRYIHRCIVLLGQHRNMSQLPREPFPTLKSYTHNQFHIVRYFQQHNMHVFDQALNTLATQDTSICYEEVQHYETLVNKYLDGTIHPTVGQLKDFVTKTLDEQHTTLSRRRFGTVNSGTLMLIPKDQRLDHNKTHESMGTCVLCERGVKCRGINKLDVQQRSHGATWQVESAKRDWREQEELTLRSCKGGRQAGRPTNGGEEDKLADWPGIEEGEEAGYQGRLR